MKKELILSVGDVFDLIFKGVKPLDEALQDTLANIIMITYLLAKRLGISFSEIDYKIKEKIRMGLLQKVEFKNQYNMTVVGNLFVPKNLAQNEKAPAIIVGHPMGAVKEQSANLYATKMAEQGFVTLAMDLSFWGESEGLPRNSVSPDIYAEDFSAAVDYLGTRDFVDKDRIGVIGICGSGSFAISEAKIDSRLKAIATVSMYDMGTATRSALGHSQSVEQRKEINKGF